MLTMIGLILNFVGSATLASIAIKTKGQILGISRQIVPVGKVDTPEDYDKIVLKMPKVQAQIKQSYIAFGGLVILAIGFLLQLISIISF